MQGNLQRLLLILWTFFLFACKPAHFKIEGIPATFKEGVIEKSFFKDQALNLIVKNGDELNTIIISPWNKDAEKIIKTNSIIKIFSKISPSGISRIISLYDGEKPYMLIASMVKENTEVMPGYRIKRGKLLYERWGERIFTDVILFNFSGSYNLSTGKSFRVKIDDRRYTFYLIGASIKNRSKSKSWIADEEADFMADYVVYIE